MPSDHTTRESCLTGLVHREFATAHNYYKLKRGACECNHEETVDGSSKYQLVNRIAGHDIVAHGGRRISDGQRVLLHQLAGSGDHTAVLKLALQYLLRNPAGGRILDVVDIAGVTYVITEDVPDCLALKEWLNWESVGAQRAAPAAPAREPGEFTELFHKSGGGAARESSEPVRSPQPAWPTEPARPTEPGEFTRQFRQASEIRPSESMPAAAPRSMPLPMGTDPPQPGEFTRLFRSPLAQPVESPRDVLPMAGPSRQSEGEFTRIFGNRTPTDNPVPHAVTPAPQPAPPAAFPGSLTESLDPHAPRATAVPGPVGGPGEFTRVVRGTGNHPAPLASAPSPAAPVVNVSLPPPSSPSLQVAAPPVIPVASAPVPVMATPTLPTIQAPQIPSSPAPAPTGAAGPAGPGRRLALIILFVVLLLAALALILVVIFRK